MRVIGSSGQSPLTPCGDSPAVPYSSGPTPAGQPARAVHRRRTPKRRQIATSISPIGCEPSCLPAPVSPWTLPSEVAPSTGPPYSAFSDQPTLISPSDQTTNSIPSFDAEFARDDPTTASIHRRAGAAHPLFSARQKSKKLVDKGRTHVKSHRAIVVENSRPGRRAHAQASSAHRELATAPKPKSAPRARGTRAALEDS